MTSVHKNLLVGVICVAAIVMGLSRLSLRDNGFQLVDNDVQREVESDPLAFLQRIRGRNWRALPEPSRAIWLTLHFERLLSDESWAPQTRTSGRSGPVVEIPPPTPEEIQAAYAEMQLSTMASLVAAYFQAAPSDASRQEALATCREQASTVRSHRRAYISRNFSLIAKQYAPF